MIEQDNELLKEIMKVNSKNKVIVAWMKELFNDSIYQGKWLFALPWIIIRIKQHESKNHQEQLQFTNMQTFKNNENNWMNIGILLFFQIKKTIEMIHSHLWRMQQE